MKLAAIDIGTNSIHMVVVELNRARGFEVIDREKVMVKLGAGMFRSLRLTPRAFNDAVEVMRRYCRLAESLGVDELLAVATSAVREAENGTELLETIFRETGVTARVISGTEEARLIFLAVRHALDLGHDRTLAFDIGGGSVEVVVGDANQVFMTQSLRLGVQRLLDRQGGSAPLSDRQIHELQGYIRGAAQEVMLEARRLGFSRVVGTSGTVRTLCEGAHLVAGGAPWRTLNAQLSRRKDLRELTRRLVEVDSTKRARMPGIGEARADNIHLGGILLTELLELAGAEELILCDASLREGVLWDYLERHGNALLEHRPIWDPRRRSVVELARKYERDDPRERHIAELALSLFDDTQTMHELGPQQRELLEYAALLHGIGRQISYADRQRHSRYIIRHSALRGFTEDEIETLGLIVYYHRQAPPKKGHKRLAGLDASQQRIVEVLSGMLRLAVALDRGHSQLVKRVFCRILERGVELTIDGPGDLELELWAARNKIKPLAKALHCKITFERLITPRAAE